MDEDGEGPVADTEEALAGLPVRLMQNRFAALSAFIVRMQGVVIALGSHDFLTSNEDQNLIRG